MLRLAPILFLCTIMYAQQTPSEWWAASDSSQKASIRGSYDRNKQYDKGFTLAALNAIESSGGLHLFRSGENSAGLYAQRGSNVAKRINKWKRLQIPFDSLYKFSYRDDEDVPTRWDIDRSVQDLMLDQTFDDRHARAHLDELLRQYGGNWVDVHQAWNGKKVRQAEDVNAWIVFLKYNLEWD